MKKKLKGVLRSPAVPSESGLSLHYKVVELSTVDEGTIEQAVNHWVSQGWNLENIQFAMRESSKRPAMAFVFFTRRGVLPKGNRLEMIGDRARARPVSHAFQRLRELSEDAEVGRE